LNSLMTSYLYVIFIIYRFFFFFFFFFFNDTATTEIYTLSLHDALPICFTFAAAAGLPALTASPVVGSVGNVTGPYVPVAATSAAPAPTPGGALPTTYTFTPADAGSHVFTLFFL